MPFGHIGRHRHKRLKLVRRLQHLVGGYHVGPDRIAPQHQIVPVLDSFNNNVVDEMLLLRGLVPTLVCSVKVCESGEETCIAIPNRDQEFVAFEPDQAGLLAGLSVCGKECWLSKGGADFDLVGFDEGVFVDLQSTDHELV